MHLISCHDSGKFVLQSFYENVPPYAIVSHCWGSDEPHLYERINRGEDTSHETSSLKLRFCLEKAAEKGISHIWIDAACIVWSSSAETTETINSSFTWYKEAAVCLVYLYDGSLPSDAPQNSQSSSYAKSQLQRSRWFTRAWTLHELLAPEKVEFYSTEGQYLGDKVSLLEDIRAASGIPADALHGTKSLSDFSVEERWSWSSHRQARRPEDWANSLLGVFDVLMPIIYGEGETRAIARLVADIKKTNGGTDNF